MQKTKRALTAYLPISKIEKSRLLTTKKMQCTQVNEYIKKVTVVVPVYEVFRVYELDSSDHLVRQHKNCFHSESTRAEVEEIFEAGAEKVHNQ